MPDRKILERYSRNILIPEVNEEGQIKILNSKILIAGAGGLGSTVIANMASIGVGTLGIVDNDSLEISNLNRQYIHKFNNIGTIKVESAKEWVNNFNPDININIYPTRLNEKNYTNIIKDYDIIIDCFDSFNSKFLLNKIAVHNNKILIHGGVSEFYGQVTTIYSTETACLNCILPGGEDKTIPIKGVISPAVTTIASIQSMETVKIILGIESSLKNTLLTYDGLNMSFKKINIGKNKYCGLCSKK